MTQKHSSNDRPLMLVVDDELSDRLMFKEALEHTVYQCRTVFFEQGNELIQFLRHYGDNPYEDELPAHATDVTGVIILDLNMPVIHGLDLLEMLKNEPFARSIPVIILTANVTEDITEKCYKAGASSVIRKPLDFEELMRIMEAICSYWLNLSMTPRVLKNSLSSDDLLFKRREDQ